MYVCIVFLWYVHVRVYNYLDSVTISTFHAGAGVAPTTVSDSSIVHTQWKNKLNRRREWEREARQNESEIKKKVRLEVRII